MAEDAAPPRIRGARYKFTGGGEQHPDAMPSADGGEWVSRAPGGLRVKSKYLPVLKEGEQLEDHLHDTPVADTRTRRVQRTPAVDIASLERGGHIQATSPITKPPSTKEPARGKHDDQNGESELDALVDVVSRYPNRSHLYPIEGRGQNSAGQQDEDQSRSEADDSAGQDSDLDREHERERGRIQEANRSQGQPGKPKKGKAPRKKNDAQGTKPSRPARRISPHVGPTQNLLMGKHMPPYHGSKPIPNDIAKLRNDIVKNFLHPTGAPTTRRLHAKYRNDFQTDGVMKVNRPLTEFYMDIRLFTPETWDYFMLHWRKGEYKHHARLGEFFDTPAQAVPPPAGYDYDALLPVEGEDEDDDQAAAQAELDQGVVEAEDGLSDQEDSSG